VILITTVAFGTLCQTFGGPKLPSAEIICSERRAVCTARYTAISTLGDMLRLPRPKSIPRMVATQVRSQSCRLLERKWKGYPRACRAIVKEGDTGTQHDEM
jgi:hypothetical protein